MRGLACLEAVCFLNMGQRTGQSSEAPLDMQYITQARLRSGPEASEALEPREAELGDAEPPSAPLRVYRF